MEGAVRKDIKNDLYHLFTSLVLPNFVYDLPICGTFEPDLNIIQNLLGRSPKCPFISYPVSIEDLLKKQDCKIFKKVMSINNHSLSP